MLSVKAGWPQAARSVPYIPRSSALFQMPELINHLRQLRQNSLPSTSLFTVASPSISQPPNSVIDTAPPLLIVVSISAASFSIARFGSCSIKPHSLTLLTLLHLPHPRHALFLRRPPLYPIPYRYIPGHKSNLKAP
ncbi:hypothetical protein TNCV_422621 [Trichonephila clavipes]|nr:hypothetical protein TNCV_422621 [Trichonephila clavipes]